MRSQCIGNYCFHSDFASGSRAFWKLPRAVVNMMGIQQVVDSVIQLDFERPLEGSCDFVMSEHDSNGASSALEQAMVCCVEDSPVTLITSTSESRIDVLHQCPPRPLFGKELLHVLHKYYVWPQARALLQDPLDAAPDEAPPGTSSTSTRRVFRAVILKGGVTLRMCTGAVSSSERCSMSPDTCRGLKFNLRNC